MGKTKMRKDEWFWKMIQEVNLEEAIASVTDWQRIAEILETRPTHQVNYGGSVDGRMPTM